MVPLGPHRPHLHRLPRLARAYHDRTGSEVEGNAKHIGVLDVELVVLVQLVRLPPERPAHHLFAQELRSEGAHSQDVGYGAGVPPLGEHGHRHHAADVLPQPAFLADCVHRFAQEFLLRYLVGLLPVASAFLALPPEPFDQVGSGAAEVIAEFFPGLQLMAVDQQGARDRVAVVVFIEVSEQRESPVNNRGRAILVGALEPGYVVVDQLGCGRVVTNDDETGWTGSAVGLPLLEGLLVVAVEGLKGSLQRRRKVQWVQVTRPAPSRARHVPADVLPQVAEHWHVGSRDVVRNRNTRELDDAALNGVHEREVAGGPGEQGSLGVPGATEEEGRGRQVHHLTYSKFPLDHLQPGEPHPGFLGVPVCFPLVLTSQRAFVSLSGLLPITVVSFVVEDHYVFQGHQLGHHPLHHLALGLHGLDGLARPLQQIPPTTGYRQSLPGAQAVIVGDDNPGPLQVAQHIGGHQLPAGVVAVGVVRLQHPQPVPDCNSGRDHQEAPREPPAVGMPHCVDGLPCDDHGHHRGLARTGGQLQRNPQQFGVRLQAGVFQTLECQPFPLPEPRRDLGQPDYRLNGFDLAEEGTVMAELVVPPVLEQQGRLRRNAPVVGIGDGSPLVDVPANFVDGGSNVILLLCRGQTLPFVEDQLLLATTTRPSPLPRLGNGRDELGPPTTARLICWVG